MIALHILASTLQLLIIAVTVGQTFRARNPVAKRGMVWILLIELIVMSSLVYSFLERY